MRTAIVLLLVLAPSVPAADILRVSQIQDELRVDPPKSFDWKTLLVQKLGPGAEKPSAARLRQLWDQRGMEACGCSAEDVDLPVPASIAKRFYYLLSPSGVTPVVPNSLSGSVLYRWNRERTMQLKEITFTGDILMNSETQAAGFVLASDSPLQFQVASVDISSVRFQSPKYRDTTVSWMDRGFTRTAPVESGYGLLAAKALHASRVRILPDNVEYLFVRQETAEATCDFAFSLLKITANGLELTAWNGYACDL